MRKTMYPFLLVAIAAVLGMLMNAALITSAQNANSSTTTTSSNTNASKPSKPRQAKPKPKPATEATSETAATAETTAPSPRRTGCDPNKQEPADLSGTYTGKLQHGDNVREATLTISGSSITMTSGSDTITGRITAVKTCDYTAVTIMHGDGGTSEPGKPAPVNKVISLRAKKVGNSLTLTSVEGEPEKVMFTTGGGARRPRRNSARRPPPPPAPPSQQ